MLTCKLRPLLRYPRCFFHSSPLSMAIPSHVLKEAESHIGYPPSFMSLRHLLSDKIANVAYALHKVAKTQHPLVHMITDILQNKTVSNVHGIVLLLLAKMVNERVVEMPHDLNKETSSYIFDQQRQLVEIIETIRFGNLLHSQVVETSTDELQLGNRLSILIGDYLLASAAVGLAKLRIPEVVGLVSSGLQSMTEYRILLNKLATDMRLITHIEDYQKWHLLKLGSLLGSAGHSLCVLAMLPKEETTSVINFCEKFTLIHSISEDYISHSTGVKSGDLYSLQQDLFSEVQLALDPFKDNSTKQTLLSMTSHLLVDS